MEHLPCALIGDGTSGEIDTDHITGLDPITSLRAFKDGEPDIDCVAVENPCKGPCDYAADPTLLDGDGSMLTARTTTEILVSYHDIALFHLFDEILVDILHTVGGQLLVIGGIEIPRWDDYIGIDVVPISKNRSSGLHLTPP
jgi:hypothetical protein